MSPTPLTLHARLADGSTIAGQSQIMRTSGIERVWLSPDGVSASQDALAAIADAELIVLGPGSLFTSLLPSLLIPAIRDAVLAASAPKIFVCNVATQDGETTGFDLADHVEVLIGHTSPAIADVVLANNQMPARPDATPRPRPSGCAGRLRRRRRRGSSSTTSSTRTTAHHHDPVRLADAVIRALEQESGIRRRTSSRSA